MGQADVSIVWHDNAKLLNYKNYKNLCVRIDIFKAKVIAAKEVQCRQGFFRLLSFLSACSLWYNVFIELLVNFTTRGFLTDLRWCKLT